MQQKKLSSISVRLPKRGIERIQHLVATYGKFSVCYDFVVVPLASVAALVLGIYSARDDRVVGYAVSFISIFGITRLFILMALPLHKQARLLRYQETTGRIWLYLVLLLGSLRAREFLALAVIILVVIVVELFEREWRRSTPPSAVRETLHQERTHQAGAPNGTP